MFCLLFCGCEGGRDGAGMVDNFLVILLQVAFRVHSGFRLPPNSGRSLEASHFLFQVIKYFQLSKLSEELENSRHNVCVHNLALSSSNIFPVLASNLNYNSVLKHH